MLQFTCPYEEPDLRCGHCIQLLDGTYAQVLASINSSRRRAESSFNFRAVAIPLPWLKDGNLRTQKLYL
jgi:hypothetical protein